MSDLESLFRDVVIVPEELMSTIMPPIGGHLAQQHVILVVLAQSQARHLHAT